MEDQKLSVIISGCMANKRKAQEELYLFFYPGMYRLCMRYLQADDLVPEALNTGFLKVFTKIKSYQENKGNFKSWITSVMIRSCIDLQRSELRFQHYEDISELSNIAPLLPDALDRLYANDLLTYVRALPQATQMVFNLYEVDGFDHKEIAGMLNISESTSRWHLSSAKQQLRQFINQKK